MKTEMLRRLFALGFLLSLFTFIALSAFLVLVHPELPASAEVSDKDVGVVFYPQSNYLHPGETSTFYFDIINKGYGTANKTDIDLKVSYYGNIVYEKSEASIRDYKQGEKVVITTKQQLPLITPPGEYLMEFGFRPDNADERYAPTQLKYKVYVQPSFYQLLFSFLGVLIFGYSFYFKKVKIAINSSISLLRKNYKHFTVGQRFLFIGICAIMITALLLILGMESLANQVAIVAYYLLVIGIANNLLEYLNFGDSKVNYVLSAYAFTALVYLSINNGISELFAGVTIIAVLCWAAFKFIELNNKQREILLKICSVILSLWIILNLLKGSMPYYSATALLVIILVIFIYSMRRRSQ